MPETDDKKKVIAALAKGKCPDCGSDEFYEGPSGGMSTNILCSGCGHEFNHCAQIPDFSHRNGNEFNPARNSAFGLHDDWRPHKINKGKRYAFVIHKSSRAPTLKSYSGSAWDRAKARHLYNEVWFDETAAKWFARMLNGHNPVGFVVSKVELPDDWRPTNEDNWWSRLLRWWTRLWSR